MQPWNCNPLACQSSIETSVLPFLNQNTSAEWFVHHRKLLVGRKSITKGLSFWNRGYKNKIWGNDCFCGIAWQQSLQLFLGTTTGNSHSESVTHYKLLITKKRYYSINCKFIFLCVNTNPEEIWSVSKSLHNI